MIFHNLFFGIHVGGPDDSLFFVHMNAIDCMIEVIATNRVPLQIKDTKESTSILSANRVGRNLLEGDTMKYGIDIVVRNLYITVSHNACWDCISLRCSLVNRFTLWSIYNLSIVSLQIVDF